MVVYIVIGAIAILAIVLLALLISLKKRKNIGEIDVTFDKIYDKHNLKKIVKNSATVGKYNSPFIEEQDIDTKVKKGIILLNKKGIIYNKETDYDNRPNW